MKKLLVAFAAVAAGVSAFAADDMTVAYGETLNITVDTTYSNLVVNGTLNVAAGTKLTCDTFILGDNLDHTQDLVAKMTVGSNATVKVNNVETLSGGSYISTGYCIIGNNSRAELTLEGGSTFLAYGRIKIAPGCTGTVDKVVYAKVKVNDATLQVEGPIYFLGSSVGSGVIENAVLELNGRKALAQARNIMVEEHKNNARIKFNGGQVLAKGWWNWGNQAVLHVPRNGQKLWVESVNGNPIYLSSCGGSNTKAFFQFYNPWPYDGQSKIYFEGTGPLVLNGLDSVSIPLCYTYCSSVTTYDSLSALRIMGKVSLGNTESIGLGTNFVKKLKLEIAPHSTFDVCGTSFDISALESAGTITNTSATAAQLKVGGANGDVVLSSPTLSPGVSLVKVGTGKLCAPAGPLNDIEVQSGSFDFCDRKSVGFPYYRYWVYRKSQGGGDNGGHCGTVRLSELELYKDGASVRDEATHVSWKKYGVNDSSPTNLFSTVSNLTWSTQWYNVDDARSSNCLFTVVHFGGAPSFKFTSVLPYTPYIDPLYDPIEGRPLVDKMHEVVTSYKFRLGSTQWFGYTNPEYFRFQGGYGNDEWVDLEDWETRGRYTKLGSGDSYNWSDEFPLTYPVNPVTVENLSVAAGTTWTIDCLQTDLTVGTLTIGSAGTLQLTNYAAARAAGLLDRHGLPVAFTTLVGDQNLKNWLSVIDGVASDRELCAVDGHLAFRKPGVVLMVR